MGGVIACMMTAGASAGVTLDFETEDDFLTSLVNGQSIGQTGAFGNMVAISSTQTAVSPSQYHLGATIFDSSPTGPNMGGPDPDLLADLGNILILQSPDNPLQTTPGIFDTPNDTRYGGSIVFDFLQGPVRMDSVQLVDVNGSGNVTVVMTDSSNRTRTYFVPDHWTNDLQNAPLGYGTLDLTTLAPQSADTAVVTSAFQDAGFDRNDVMRIEFIYNGSGAINDLSFSTNVPVPAAALLAVMGMGFVGARRKR
jgi:hypothetical protein